MSSRFQNAVRSDCHYTTRIANVYGKSVKERRRTNARIVEYVCHDHKKGLFETYCTLEVAFQKHLRAIDKRKNSLPFKRSPERTSSKCFDKRLSILPFRVDAGISINQGVAKFLC